jgi:hypothetical protein
MISAGGSSHFEQVGREERKLCAVRKVQMQNARSFLRRLIVTLPVTLTLIGASAVLAATPALIGLSPASVTAGGEAFTLTIQGKNFTPATSSMWDATPLSTTYQSSTELTAAVPSSLIVSSGTVRVTVTMAGGASSSASLIINPPPPAPAPTSALAAAPSTFTPGINDGSQTSSLTRSVSVRPSAVQSAPQMAAMVPANLNAAAAGALSEYTLTVSPSLSATTAQAATNQGAAQLSGTARVSMVNTLSGAFAGVALDVGTLLPTIASLSPASAVAGGVAFTLTINGGNFTSSATALWGNTPLATTYISATQLMVAVPPSLISNAGTVSIEVVTPGGASSALPFTVTPAVPVISSISPGRITAGSSAFTLRVVGSYIGWPSTVNWGSTPLATSAFAGSIVTAQVPANLLATTGTVNVTVTTAGGTSAPVSFVVAPQIPVITSLSPSSAAAGGAAFTLTVNGTGFVPGMSISFGATSSGVTWLGSTYVSSTQVTTTVPASLIATAGLTGVIIYEPGVGFSPSAPFAINPAPPAITSLSPASATAGGAGFMLTVNGTAFTQGVTSMWGTTALDTIYVSPTQLRISVPASLIQYSGTASITVITAAGASAPLTYTINQSPPTISSFSTFWATAGGAAFTLSIGGSYFTSASVVKWGLTSLVTTCISTTQLTAVVPASLIATPGKASISVGTEAGTSAPFTFSIYPPLQITTTALPAGTAGVAYSGPINVAGGAPGYNWTVTGLPDSLTFFNTMDSTLTITGTPATSGAITIQVSATDTTGTVAGPVTYTINVDAGPSGANNASLQGSYACLFQGSNDWDSTRWATVASFQADGQGNFTSGVFDTNSYDTGPGSGMISGSYSIGSDYNGSASIHTVLTAGAAGIQTTHWAIALSGAAQPARQFRMIETDDLGTLPSGQQGSANCYQATTGAFAQSTISGSSFVFGLGGEDNSGNMKATSGLFSAAAGNSAAGYIDIAQGGVATVQSSAFTATYTAPDPASGRFSMALQGAGNSTGFAVYIIDANRMFLLDNTDNDGEQAGNMRTQQQAAYSGTNLNGPFVLYLRGAEFNLSGSTPSGFYSDLFQGTGDGAGNLTVNQRYTNNAGVFSASQSNGSPLALAFDSAHPGRAIFPSVSGTTYLYLFNNSSALAMSVGDNGSLDSGWLEPQAQTAFTNAALAGSYLFGNLPLLNFKSSNSVGVFSVTADGAVNAALTTTSPGILYWDQSASMAYSWDQTAPGTGAFLVANGAQAGASCAVINATKFVCVSQTSLAPSVEAIEQ